jgi:trimeric autotransporter adhesin
MKTKYLGALALLLSTLNPQLSTLFAQGTAFSYQGQLTDSGNPANGSFDLRFGLFPVAGGGLQIAITTNSAVPITNGLFTVLVDFGSNAFNSANWLEIGARPVGGGAFATLSPRQQITPTPYAIRAANFSGPLSASQLAGVVTNGAANLVLSGKFTGTLSGSSTGTFTGTFIGNGGGLTNISVTQLGGRTADDFWQLAGNNVTPGDILGSTNNQTLEFIANNVTALQLQPNAMALPNLIGGNGNTIASDVDSSVIGGGFANQIQTNVSEAVIAGGGFNTIGPGSYDSAIGGGDNNKIMANATFANIVGGNSQVIETNGNFAFIGGGLQNSLPGNNSFSSIVGGNANTISIGGGYSTIGGGKSNTNGASLATIAGGELNAIQAGADRSTISGGSQNITTGAHGTVPGGFGNSAAAQSFAAGRRAKATLIGTFVWGDSTDADISSTAANSVTMRASSGYRLFSNGAATLGVSLAANGTAWGVISDRDAKKNIQPVDAKAVLEKLAQVPVQKWNYKAEADDAVPHLGPMAQDFKGAFFPGRDDKVITTLEFDGVELAAIQGLNEKVEARSEQAESDIQNLKTENAELKRQNATLEQRLETLEKIVLQKKSH